MDAKQSWVTSATQKRFKSELPRLRDAVNDCLAFMSDLREDETVEQLVADISDAFWLVPLNPAERQYFVAQFRGQYLVFQSTAQGSRTAPPYILRTHVCCCATDTISAFER